MNEERLANIELKLTWAEDLLQDLNTLVYRQQKRIDHLERLCETLSEHVRSLAEPGSPRSLRDEIPPHY